MKKLLAILVCMFTFLPANCEVITGGVEYSVSDARNEVFSTAPIRPDSNLIQQGMIDSDRIENYSMLLKGVTDLKDRTLAKFSDGSYGVIYKDNPKNVFYYSPEGILTHNEIKTSLEYPYKTYKYTPHGKLVNMSLRVSEKETFIFNPSGKLIAHWLGVNCYDEDGNIIMTRKIFE